MAERRNWTEEEVRRALALYLQTPFGKFHQHNPSIIHLARQIGRTPSAVALKLSNLAAIDDSLDRRGMANASKTDRKVWQDFLNNPTDVITADDELHSEISYQQRAEDIFVHGFGEGIDKKVQTIQRQGQALFRKTILTSYNSRCALTDVDDRRLLIASHIIGWADRPETRMNPHNGICLNALHDRAFDKHLISFGENYELLVSEKLTQTTQATLQRVKHRRLRLPDRFLPSQDFLEVHRRKFVDLTA